MTSGPEPPFAMRIRSVFLTAVLLALAAPASPRASGAPFVAIRLLAPRATMKTGGRISADGLTSTVVVKFREGLDASLEDGRAVAAIAATAVPDGVRPTFSRPAEELRAEKSRLEPIAGVELADL